MFKLSSHIQAFKLALLVYTVILLGVLLGAAIIGLVASLVGLLGAWFGVALTGWLVLFSCLQLIKEG